MESTVLGTGPLGRAIEASLRARGESVCLLGRPPDRAGHDPTTFGTPVVVFEASRADAVASNVGAGLRAGCRRFVIATTGWTASRPEVDAALRSAGASAVAAPNLSLGAALFLRLVETATDLFGPVADFEPYLVEWHRRGKRDRPSGTALELARRIVARHPRITRSGPPDAADRPDTPDRPGAADRSGDTPRSPDELEVVAIRAGSSPGSHLVGFDAPGETVELRLTARDRSAYAAGALAAADWLVRAPRAPGLHSFDPVVDELLASRVLAATA
jgi:4-hydroxy-tetrahydrodipicolinate reductase